MVRISCRLILMEANIDVETLPKLKVNPAVKQGRTRLTQSWQPLGYMGVFPTIEDGGTQVPLSPHWGGVNAYSFESTSTGLELGSFNRPYLENGLLNDEFIRQSKFVAQLSTQLGSESKGSSNLRAQAEYWELGDSTTYPPGWWLSKANILAEQEMMSFKKRLNFLRDLSYAGSDSAIKLVTISIYTTRLGLLLQLINYFSDHRFLTGR